MTRIEKLRERRARWRVLQKKRKQAMRDTFSEQQIKDAESRWRYHCLRLRCLEECITYAT